MDIRALVSRWKVAAVLLGMTAAVGAQQPAAVLGPSEDSISDGSVGEAIRLGQKILQQTPAYAVGYTGNSLSCTNCHSNGGRTPYVSPWVGIWGVFPEYRSRNDRVNILEDRINDCFERSQNG